uniref:Putative secreted protein n=1 Tax=Ixodes ricinus TaxID=34613 RepID=A0A6B0UPS4_IXORI
MRRLRVSSTSRSLVARALSSVLISACSCLVDVNLDSRLLVSSSSSLNASSRVVTLVGSGSSMRWSSWILDRSSTSSRFMTSSCLLRRQLSLRLCIRLSWNVAASFFSSSSRVSMCFSSAIFSMI